METDRPSRADGPYSPKHSTGGFLGSRSARVVAAGFVVAAGAVGVVASTGHDRPEQVQVLPSATPLVTTAVEVAPTAVVTAVPRPDVVAPPSNVVRTPAASPPTSSSPPPPTSTPPVAPPETTAPAPGRVLLRETIPLPDLPPGWDVPTGATSVQVPLPDPVTVTGEVTTPAPDEVQVEITVGRGTRPRAD